MSIIKRYIVEEPFKEYSVSLEADLEILTEERATMINQFWSGHEDRLAEQEGDVQQAVVRLFGQHAIRVMLEDGGAEFSAGPLPGNRSAGRFWSGKVWNEEGWGGRLSEDGDFGWCGIRVAAADVKLPSYDEVELREIEIVED